MLLLLLTAQALAWRFEVTWLAVVFAISSLAYAAVYAERYGEHWRRAAIAALLLACIVALCGQFEAIWPCDLGCSSGKSYSITLFELSTLLLATITYGLCLVALVLIKSERLVRGMLFLPCGASLYFLGLSLYLGMLCPICLSIHGAVLCAGIVAWPYKRAATATHKHGLIIASSIAIGILTPGLFFFIRDSILLEDINARQRGGPKPINHHSTKPTTGQKPDQQQQAVNQFMQQHKPAARMGTEQIIQEIKVGRLIGAADATYRLECHLSLSCSHCERLAPRIYNSAQALSAAYSLNVDTKYLINHASQRDIQRHYLAMAGALRGEFVTAQSVLFGNHAVNIGFIESLNAIGLDGQALQVLVDQHADSMAQVNLDDREALYAAKVTAQSTPIFILWKGDKVIAHWDAKTAWPAIHQAIEEHIR